jgi:hypothetical protein
MDLTIDHIESGIAVLIGREDSGVRITLPVTLLPPDSREGDILALTLVKDPLATEAARARSADRIERISNKSR